MKVRWYQDLKGHLKDNAPRSLQKLHQCSLERGDPFLCRKSSPPLWVQKCSKIDWCLSRGGMLHDPIDHPASVGKGWSLPQRRLCPVLIALFFKACSWKTCPKRNKLFTKENWRHFYLPFCVNVCILCKSDTASLSLPHALSQVLSQVLSHALFYAFLHAPTYSEELL